MTFSCCQQEVRFGAHARRSKPGYQRFGTLPSEFIYALQRPELLADEYRRRLINADNGESRDAERKQLGVALKRIKAQEDRITDAYINEAMDLKRYKAEMDKLRQHQTEIERRTTELDQRQQQDQDAQNALEHLNRFCHRISKGLDALTFDDRQQLLRLVVERITVDNGRVRVDTVIPTDDGNLRNRYPELVEGSARGGWFDRLTTNGLPTPGTGTPSSRAE